MNPSKVAVDTDLVFAHLTETRTPSLLRTVMNSFFCYTTVFNAIELFSFARTEEEVQAVDDALYSMKVLGLNAKGAKNVGRILSSVRNRKGNDFAALIAGLCIESKLPIISMNPKRFKGIEGLQVISARSLKRISIKEEILSTTFYKE